MQATQIDWGKLKKVTHYICHKATDPSVLGSIKLNKVLWYSDAIHYIHHGKPITGETYVKRQHGPVPKHIVAVVDELVKEQKVARGKVDYFGHMKAEYISIFAPDEIDSTLTATEVQLIDEAFEHVCLENTAMSISEQTHGVIWELAELGEEIPLYTVYASSVGEVDEGDIEWAEEWASKLKLSNN